MINYIYMIFCKNHFDDNGCKNFYIGHTKNLKIREGLHKSSSNNIASSKYNYPIYKIIRDNGGWNNWYMIELEKFECLDERQAQKKENEYINIFNPDMNDRKSFLSKEEKKNLYKNWEIKNKEKRSQQKAIYYQENKEYKNEQFYCECGGKYTFSHKARHFKTEKHQNWLNSCATCS